MSALCALLAPLVYAFAVETSGARIAMLVMSAIVFGTSAFKYSTGYYGHVQAGLFFFGAVLL